MTSTLERREATDEAPKSGLPAVLAPRPPRSRLWRRLLGALIALLVVVSALAVPTSMGLFPSVYQPPLPDDAALAVGNDIVTVTQYDEKIRSIKALYGAVEPGDPAGRDRFRRDAAKSVATTMVMQQAAADMDVVVPDNKVRDQLAQMIQVQFGQGPQGQQGFVDALRRSGTSEDAVLAEIRQQQTMVALVAKVTDPVPEPRDDELPAEFPRYADALGLPEKRKLANIVVGTREQAEDIMNQLRSGIPFADIARRVSMDTSTRDRGGDLGDPVAKSQLEPGYQDAAFTVPKGQVFGPVQTPQGWNVGQVVDVIPGNPATYEESIIPLKQAVHNERKLAVYKDWYEATMRDAHVRYAPAYLPDDPDGAPKGLASLSGPAERPQPGTEQLGQQPVPQAPAQEPAPAPAPAPGPR